MSTSHRSIIPDHGTHEPGAIARPRSHRRVFTLLVAALVTLPTLSSAQAILDSSFVTNAPVYSMVRDGDRIYIGGDFSTVGPA